MDDQSIYINGKHIKTNIECDDPNQSFRLNHAILKNGQNDYAVTGRRFRKRHQWDEPNRDPGLIQVIYPARQWKRKVFNGLAQVIVQSDKEKRKIILKATSHGLESAEIKIDTKTVKIKHSL